MIQVKVKHMEMHNFLSFQDEEWDFDKTSRLVLVEGVNKDVDWSTSVSEKDIDDKTDTASNGSGKSAWSHALMYALFGQLSGKIHNSNLKNKYSDTIKDGWKMLVSVEVDTILSSSDIRHWMINRGIQKGSTTVVLQLFSLDSETGEWKDISKSSSNNTQVFIEDNVLHMNLEIYQRLVMLSVDDKYNFFKLNASQKRDFIETLFDTSMYSKMYKTMCEDMKTANLTIQNLKVNQTKLAKTKEVCEDSISQYKSNLSSQISDTSLKKIEMENRMREFNPKMAEIASQQKVVEAALAKIRESKRKIEEVVGRCNEIMTEAKIDIGNCESTIAHHQRELNKHQEVLGMICQDCQKIVNKFYSLDAYRNEIENLNSKIGEKQLIVDNCAKQILKVKELDDQIKADEMSRMDELSDMQVQEKNMQFQKAQLVKSIQDLECKISDLMDSMENESKIPSYAVYKQTLQDIDEIESKLKRETGSLCLLKVGSEIVSPESIRRNIISKVVSSINTMINANLSELGVNFTCNLTNDMNDYEIQSSGGELDFPNLSLGEQMKLIISSQLAFRKFLISRFNIHMNIMIIDEVVDRALDSVTIPKLLEMLLRLSQNENTSISIISHRSEVGTMFKEMPETQMMVVQKQDNISHIVRD